MASLQYKSLPAIPIFPTLNLNDTKIDPFLTNLTELLFIPSIVIFSLLSKIKFPFNSLTDIQIF